MDSGSAGHFVNAFHHITGSFLWAVVFSCRTGHTHAEFYVLTPTTPQASRNARQSSRCASRNMAWSYYRHECTGGYLPGCYDAS